MKQAGAWLLVSALLGLFALVTMNGATIQDQQRACEKRCAPRMGAWRPDPNYPATAQGKTVPMVCSCQ